MVQGISKRVVVVKSPDKRIFEEAIFILREDALSSSGVSAEDIVKEACRAASGYLRRGRGKRFIKPAMFTAAGLALAGLGWGIAMIL